MRSALAIMALLLFSFSAAPAIAQQTSQPITLVVPYPAGGTADVLARMVATGIGPVLGQTIIVDNKPGAAGTVAAGFVSRAKPDGLTLLFTNAGPSAIAPAMSKKPTYDPVKDFTAVSLVARSPLLLVVNSSLEVKDLRSLIEYAKAHPGKVEYSSPGIGSFTHLATEQFAQAAGIRLLHVPYQGQAPAVTAVAAGEVKMSLTSPSGFMFDMVRTGKLRLLGVSSREPSRLAPGAVPIGHVLQNFETEFWFGVLAPTKTSPATVTTLHNAIQKVLSDPAIARQMEVLGSEVASGPSDQFQQFLGTEANRWREVVRAAKIDPEN
jgi:tripartite-type tricarboxylate transporter receptor subunit TctC